MSKNEAAPSYGQRRKTSDTLRKLAQSTSGNVIAITAASLIPLTVVVGGAVDIGRAYMAKDQLQGACDAAVLAARKMRKNSSFPSTARQAGKSFFNLNFPEGTYGTSRASLQLGSGPKGSVTGVASAANTAPIFGSLSIAPKKLRVTCAADLELVNTDVMFALDTTGSMNLVNPGDSVSRLAAAGVAVKGFTAALSEIAGSSVQLRYGFVPFSSNVNVGRLLKPEWMVDSWTYQSRVAAGVTTETSTDSWTETTRNTSWVVLSGSVSESTRRGATQSGSGSELGGGSVKCKDVPSDSSNTTTVYSSWISSPYPGGGTQRTRTAVKTTTGKEYSGSVSGGQCTIKTRTFMSYKQKRTETVLPIGGTETETSVDYNWIYKPVTFNVSALKGSGPTMSGTSFVASKLGRNHTDVTVNWEGCIEERDTVRTASFSSIPSTAYDLDIDRIPDSIATRWRPHLPQLVYWRKDNKDWSLANWATTSNSTRADEYSGGAAAICPEASKKLSPMTSEQVQSYMGSLTARGTTYLDIGMIWAARLISPTGLFSGENTRSPNGKPISRHIIFMTDGEIETLNFVYDAYGLSALDRRRTAPDSVPSDSAQNALVDARLRATCEAIKSKGVTVWTIAFGTAMTDTLKSCASEGRYFMAKNSDELNAAFSSIATNIARLRLIK